MDAKLTRLVPTPGVRAKKTNTSSKCGGILIGIMARTAGIAECGNAHQECFSEYLNKEEEAVQSHHCAADWDYAQHMLEDCSARAFERPVLVDQIARHLSPPTIIAAMLAGE